MTPAPSPLHQQGRGQRQRQGYRRHLRQCPERQRYPELHQHRHGHRRHPEHRRRLRLFRRRCRPAAATPATCPRANMWAASAAIPTQTPPSPTAITPAASPPDNIPAASAAATAAPSPTAITPARRITASAATTRAVTRIPFTNCYYLDTTCSSAIGGTGKGTATAKTDTAFASAR